jgi:predicted RNA-binding Zn ribbon-like protein
MIKRKLLAVGEMPLVGGALCLDFVNTTGARRSRAPRERLVTYRDLLVWSRRAGILDPARADQLAGRSRAHPREAQAALARARALRESLYAVLCPVAEGAEPAPRALADLEAWRRADCRQRTLVSDSGTFELRLRVEETALDAMVWPVVSSAVDLLVSSYLARLKRCGECDWLFLDESKNGSRTWCKKACGDRVRARRYYGRRGSDARP